MSFDILSEVKEGMHEGASQTGLQYSHSLTFMFELTFNASATDAMPASPISLWLWLDKIMNKYQVKTFQRYEMIHGRPLSD